MVLEGIMVRFRPAGSSHCRNTPCGKVGDQLIADLIDDEVGHDAGIQRTDAIDDEICAADRLQRLFRSPDMTLINTRSM